MLEAMRHEICCLGVNHWSLPSCCILKKQMLDIDEVDKQSSMSELEEALRGIRRIWGLALLVGLISNSLVGWLMLRLPNGPIFDLLVYIFCFSAAISIALGMVVARKLLTYKLEDFVRDVGAGKSISRIVNLG